MPEYSNKIIEVCTYAGILLCVYIKLTINSK